MLSTLPGSRANPAGTPRLFGGHSASHNPSLRFRWPHSLYLLPSKPRCYKERNPCSPGPAEGSGLSRPRPVRASRPPTELRNRPGAGTDAAGWAGGSGQGWLASLCGRGVGDPQEGRVGSPRTGHNTGLTPPSDFGDRIPFVSSRPSPAATRSAIPTVPAPRRAPVSPNLGRSGPPGPLRSVSNRRSGPTPRAGPVAAEAAARAGSRRPAGGESGFPSDGTQHGSQLASHHLGRKQPGNAWPTGSVPLPSRQQLEGRPRL
ncbi:PREDICTED: collagen alpha-2(I) chain-like [Galeopterus variegatus]|uniref:Collagen alpha-2(I) chain-like n=1 Tax=Galeopterus variegatus TaxID=482537 RepID=A0ABM0Q2X4_GALVR|nr:PREDICTED: collagen alpha-2(I) chain-like [Galeopterus variegatus]